MEKNAKIGLPYMSEYMYAATPTYWTYPGYDTTGNGNDYSQSTGNNWMYLPNEWYWTLSPISDYSKDSVFLIHRDGRINVNLVCGSSRVRPSFSLALNVNLSGGSGTESDPYRIEV